MVGSNRHVRGHHSRDIYQKHIIEPKDRLKKGEGQKDMNVK